jgi:hypothetical protein
VGGAPVGGFWVAEDAVQSTMLKSTLQHRCFQVIAASLPNSDLHSHTSTSDDGTERVTTALRPYSLKRLGSSTGRTSLGLNERVLPTRWPVGRVRQPLVRSSSNAYITVPRPLGLRPRRFNRVIQLAPIVGYGEERYTSEGVVPANFSATPLIGTVSGWVVSDLVSRFTKRRGG